MQRQEPDSDVTPVLRRPPAGPPLLPPVPGREPPPGSSSPAPGTPWPTPAATLERVRGNPMHAVRAFFGIVVQPRTYGRLAYLLLAFPLGCFYFLVLATGAFAGATLSIVLIGLLLCIVTLVLAYVFAVFDRELVIQLLGVRVPPLAVPARSETGAFRGLLHHLRRRNTWTSIVYLCLIGPYGAVAWMVGLVLVVLPLLGIVGDLHSLFAEVAGWRGLFALDFRIGALAPLAIIGVAGLNVLDLMARGWGQFAVSMLSTSQEELRAAEAEARAASAERGRNELILNVSHELRTPIASIQGHLDTLLVPGAVEEDPDAWRPYVQTAASEAKRLGRLVDELLMLARADADNLRVDIVPVRVGPILDGVVAALRPLAKRERGVTIVCQPGAEDYWVYADPGRLTQVLTNLARNGITHTPAGGAVALGASLRGGQQVELAVADTGVGLRPDELGRIFERFYRADSARSRDSGGFGLGLAIAKDLVEAMGGTITATSEVGIGTTLRVLLRRAAPQAPQAPRPQTRAGAVG